MTTSEHDGADRPSPEDEHVMSLLEEHVPMSLIMDLAAPAGPDSADILATEGGPDEAWWVKP